jgi:hypothetical protein
MSVSRKSTSWSSPVIRRPAELLDGACSSGQLIKPILCRFPKFLARPAGSNLSRSARTFTPRPNFGNLRLTAAPTIALVQEGCGAAKITRHKLAKGAATV